jgi:polysaccharide pyruvyl transferase WcaK-like protein
MDVYSDFGNLADLLIRRGVLEWFSDLGELYLHVGPSAPESYVDALRFSGKAKIFTNKKRWMMSLARGGKDTVLVLKPGWIRLERNDLRGVVVESLLAVIARLQGAKVLAIGRGIHSYTPLMVFVHRVLLRLTHRTWWRNKWSADVAGGGYTMPDIVFGMLNDVPPQSPIIPRRRLAISLRGDKPWPRQEWLEAVREIARYRNLDIVCVVQVLWDNGRMTALAKELGCDLVEWREEKHVSQEQIVRSIYSESAFVISDRMHSLVLGAVEGAIPVGLSADASYLKAVRHFAEVGLDFICRDASELSTAEMVEFVSWLSNRSAEISANLADAVRRLREVRVEARELLNF